VFKRLWKTFFALLSSIIAVIVYNLNFNQWGNVTTTKYFFVTAYITVLGYVVFHFVIKYILRCTASLKKTQIIISVIFSMLLSLVLIICIPIQFNHIKQDFDLKIIGTGEKNSKSHASEVWLVNITVDGINLDLSKVNLMDGWMKKDGALLSYNQQKPQTLDLKLKVKENVKITFVKHAWSGIVHLNYGDNIRSIDLYSSEGSIEEVTLNPLLIPIPTLLKCTLNFSTWFLLSFFIFIFIIWGSTWSWTKHPMVVSRRKYTKLNIILYSYSFPFLLIGLIYWLSFYPATMSSDSINQWNQAMTGKFNDAHPIFHTLCIWLVTRIWPSPAAVALVQLIFSSFIIGYTAYMLEGIGIRKIFVLLVVFIYSLNPVNGIMSIVIWKDIPFSYCLLIITLLLIKIYMSDGAWLKSGKSQLYLIITLAFLYLFRHNGIVSVVGVLLVLIFYYRQYLRQIFKVSIITCIIIFIVKFPLSSLLNVAPAPSYVSMAMQLHQVGTMVHNNVKLTSEEKTVLEKIMPLTYWSGGNNYSKYNANYVIFNQAYNDNALKQNKVEFLKTWATLVLQNPRIAFNDWRDMSSLVWRITQPVDGYTYTVELDIVPNDLDLKQNSLLPKVRDFLIKAVDFTGSYDHNWMFWRPALAIYCIFLFGFIFIIRNNFKATILFVPILAQVAALILVIPAQDARYFYYCFLTLPVFVALSFYKIEHFA
jgi:hypothetical protein